MRQGTEFAGSKVENQDENQHSVDPKLDTTVPSGMVLHYRPSRYDGQRLRLPENRNRAGNAEMFQHQSRLEQIAQQYRSRQLLHRKSGPEAKESLSQSPGDFRNDHVALFPAGNS